MNQSYVRPATRGMRLSRRRLVRQYSYPWAQLIITGILAWLSIHVGVDWRVAVGWWFIAFICFIVEDLYASESLLSRLGNWLGGSRVPIRDDLDTSLEVYSIYPNPPWFDHRYQIRWWASFILLISTWFYAAGVGSFAEIPFSFNRTLLTLMLLAFAVVPYGISLISPIIYSDRRGHNASLAISILVIVFAFAALHGLTPNWLDRILGAVAITLVYLTVFVSQRLWATERVWNEILRELSLALLSNPRPEDGYETVPRLIGERMPYPRVYLLWPTDDGQNLTIEQGVGQMSRLKGQTVPVAGSLTGAAFRTGKPIAWNDVKHCAYHKPLILTDTRAEIAVPVMHQGTVYAVLDAQDTRTNVFTEGDTRALELVGRMLGSAIAADLQNKFYDRALRLTNEVAAATSEDVANEEGVFNLFADAAQRMLGADLITYYPLSLSGRPMLEPYGYGQFRRRDQLRSPQDDTAGILIPLIAAWQPEFAADVRQNSALVGAHEPDAERFIDREEVVSACFIPVGTRHERLGALFLNFRRPQAFDAMFRFTALAIGQWFANLMSQSRYRHAFRRGFGRPEFDLHNIVGRYEFSFRSRSAHSLATALLRAGHTDCDDPDACPLLYLVDKVDGLLHELSLTEAAVPPDFWEKSLREQLDAYASALQPVHHHLPQVTREIAPEIEYENPLLKMALFRIITEAINNALVRAEADRVTVDVRRAPLSIDICIENNGLPLPPDARQKGSAYGIFHLLNQAERELGARDNALVPLPAGARFTLKIPVLPVNAFFDSPAGSTSSDPFQE